MENVLLKKFLESIQDRNIHLVLPGAVISGTINDWSPITESLEIENCKVYTGASEIFVEELRIDLSTVISWGYGKISITTK